MNDWCDLTRYFDVFRFESFSVLLYVANCLQLLWNPVLLCGKSARKLKKLVKIDIYMASNFERSNSKNVTNSRCGKKQYFCHSDSDFTWNQILAYFRRSKTVISTIVEALNFNFVWNITLENVKDSWKFKIPNCWNGQHDSFWGL